MRTLVVSDLHLGQRPGHDVLRRTAALDALLAELDGIDRLVLLGDVVELQSRIAGRRAMEQATPVLRAIGARMGTEREIVYVPGNHDLVTVRPWLRDRGRALGLADEVPADATPALAAVLDALAPARVRVCYPGTWLAEGVWATHGHYLDRHLLPETTFGMLRDRPGRARPGSALPGDYERARRHRQRRRERERQDGLLASLRQRPLAVGLELLVELSRYGTGLLRGLHLTGLTSRLIDVQMRHCAVPAMAVVVRRLGVPAHTVVFGHVHRLGPGPGETWAPTGADGPRLINTGSWVYEPLLLDDASPPHPYWPGGAVRLSDGEGPAAAGLLDSASRLSLTEATAASG